MAEVTATCRTREQGARLAHLRKRLGLTKGQLIDALAFGSTQTYDLYERGVSVIRLDRVEDWAAAFGVAVEDFTSVVLGARDLDAVFPPSEPWTVTAELRGEIPESDIPAFEDEHGGKDPADARASARGVKRAAGRARTRATRGHQAGNQTA